MDDEKLYEDFKQGIITLKNRIYFTGPFHEQGSSPLIWFYFIQSGDK
ncbi:TPA: hypothetical protein IQA44_001813 [Listeria monocytogenes]|nr:hypothetical protein [Listeria monocytogenes]